VGDVARLGGGDERCVQNCNRESLKGRDRLKTHRSEGNLKVNLTDVGWEDIVWVYIVKGELM
jgi:hypothetical protein